MRSLVLLMVTVPLALHAQQGGVRFERALSWQQVQANATTAGKHVFVDVCTLGSRGCRIMDSVFREDRVGAALNERFIAVRVRGDTSAPVAAAAESLYIDAPGLRRYGITTFPTFLVFAPDGKLVHRAVGIRDVEGVLALAADALDPAKQYYVQRERY